MSQYKFKAYRVVVLIYIYCEMIMAIGLPNIHHLTYDKMIKRKKKYFLLYTFYGHPVNPFKVEMFVVQFEKKNSDIISC